MRNMITILMLLAPITNVLAEQSYAGQQQRTIKSLSKAEIEGLMSGKGMGMAKAAELNHYPGPKHVLELAGNLDLSSTQLQQTQSLFDEMKKQAIAVGKQVVEAEGGLDRLFRSGEISETVLEQKLQQIASLRARLKHVHLKTHLKQKALMSAEQVKRYDDLRGYGKKAQHEHHMHH